MMTSLVPISGKKGAVIYVKVDEEDLELVSGQPWQFSTDGYARRKSLTWEINMGAPAAIAMHRQILGMHLFKGIPGKSEVDHINRDRLDNRKENLRVVDRAINTMNRVGWGIYSKYIGVSFFKPASLWRAYINFQGKRVELGYFKTEQEAVVARDEAAKRMFGSLATLNISEGT